MPTMIVYADGHTTGASFYLTSSWVSDGTKFTSSPRAGTTSQSFTLNMPSGASLKSATIFAIVGKRWWPPTGMQTGYPTANSVTMTPVNEEVDKYLYSAPVVFSDPNVSTDVTISFKAWGNKTNVGKHKASQSFDDVYLQIEYEPPCSTWTIESSNWEHTYEGSIYGHIALTDYNKTYTHKVGQSYQDIVIERTIQPVGVESDSTNVSWMIPLDGDVGFNLMKAIPITSSVATVAIKMQTINNGVILGEETKNVTVEIPSDARPNAGVLQFTINKSAIDGMNNELALQNHSSATLWAENIEGDIYGSTISKVYIECINGNTYEIKRYYKDYASAKPDAEISGQTFVPKTEKVTTEVFSAAGEYPVKVVVIDSRGNEDRRPYDNEAEFLPSIFVTPYTPIRLLTTAQGRTGDCPLDSDLDSWYAKIVFSHSNYASNVSCSLSLTLVASDGSETHIPIGAYISNTKLEISSPARYCLDKNLTYKIIYTISDGLTTASVTKLIGSSYAFMRWEPNKNAIGFGCYPGYDNSNCVEIASDWNQIINGGLLMTNSEDGTHVPIQEYIKQIVESIVQNNTN